MMLDSTIQSYGLKSPSGLCALIIKMCFVCAILSVLCVRCPPHIIGYRKFSIVFGTGSLPVYHFKSSVVELVLKSYTGSRPSLRTDSPHTPAPSEICVCAGLIFLCTQFCNAAAVPFLLRIAQSTTTTMVPTLAGVAEAAAAVSPVRVATFFLILHSTASPALHTRLPTARAAGKCARSFPSSYCFFSQLLSSGSITLICSPYEVTTTLDLINSDNKTKFING